MSSLQTKQRLLQNTFEIGKAFISHNIDCMKNHDEYDNHKHINDVNNTVLTSSAREKWLKKFSDSHRIYHFNLAMIKGIIYTNLEIVHVDFILIPENLKLYQI